MDYLLVGYVFVMCFVLILVVCCWSRILFPGGGLVWCMCIVLFVGFGDYFGVGVGVYWWCGVLTGFAVFGGWRIFLVFRFDCWCGMCLCVSFGGVD